MLASDPMNGEGRRGGRSYRGGAGVGEGGSQAQPDGGRHMRRRPSGVDEEDPTGAEVAEEGGGEGAGQAVAGDLEVLLHEVGGTPGEAGGYGEAYGQGGGRTDGQWGKDQSLLPRKGETWRSGGGGGGGRRRHRSALPGRALHAQAGDGCIWLNV